MEAVFHKIEKEEEVTSNEDIEVNEDLPQPDQRENHEGAGNSGKGVHQWGSQGDTQARAVHQWGSQGDSPASHARNAHQWGSQGEHGWQASCLHQWGSQGEDGGPVPGTGMGISMAGRVVGSQEEERFNEAPLGVTLQHLPRVTHGAQVGSTGGRQ